MCWTEMNAESSRSHLILGIVIESTNLTSGAVVKGKVCYHGYHMYIYLFVSCGLEGINVAFCFS